MARLTILEHPDPRLRMESHAVLAFDGSLARLVDDLFETLYATSGIGLSAPQAGVLQQVVVADLSDDASAPEVYVNPELLSRAGLGLVEESCLSVPGVVGNVIRAARIRIRAHDRAGEMFERDLEGMHAVCLQHEMDHLKGKLFIDRLSIFRRLRMRAAEAVRSRNRGESAARRSGTG